VELLNSHYRLWFTLLAASLVAASSAGCVGWRYGSFCFHTIEPAQIRELRASERVRRAYSLLRDTEQFASSHTDYAGAPSCEVIAFQTLLNSRIADQAFKSLLKSATLEGQLYALSGLYFTDPKSFTMHIARYREMNDLVTTHFGCEIGPKSVAAVVDASDALDPDSLEEWHRQNPLAEYPPVDIASGGWPREFKKAFK
jgi:hypothetical protein